MLGVHKVVNGTPTTRCSVGAHYHGVMASNLVWMESAMSMRKIEDLFLAYSRAQTGFFRLLELKNGWARDIPKVVRFILLLVSTFFTYGIFKALGGLNTNQINEILNKYFSDPGFFVVGTYVLFWSIVGVYSSILTAALFNSLTPKP